MVTKTEAVKAVSDNLTPLQQALLDRADSIMDSMARTVEQASSFAAEQVPDIALQYVAYGRASLTAYVALSLVMLAVAFYLGVRIGVMNSRGYREDSYSWDDRRSAAMIVSVPTAIIGMFVFLHNLNNLIMVWIAPKIWLINEIAHLVKR